MANHTTGAALNRGNLRARAAILDPARTADEMQVGREAAPDGLADLVDYLWWVRWNVAEPHVQEVIPRPVIHVAAEIHCGEPRLMVTGVMRQRFERRLAGSGHTVAAGFRPGGFRPFIGVSVSSLTGRAQPAAEILGVDDRRVADSLLTENIDITDATVVLADWLAALAPAVDPRAVETAELVERAESDHSIRRADQLARLAGVSLQTLQRLFTEYVGVGPKWAVQRFRLLDIAAAAHSEEPVQWADLATELGYADQSHLIRAFSRVTGQSPASYAARS